MGCCDAWVLSCEGAIDGKPFDWDDYPDDLTKEQESEIIDQIVTHHWYEDTGEPAPGDGGPLPCRCEGRRHIHV